MSSMTDQFMSVYAEIQSALLDQMKSDFELDPNRARYLKYMMDTTCLGGKYNRGMTVVEVAASLSDAAGHDAATRQRILHDACVCGWMVEFLQAHYLVEDDIMDKSKTRRGKPCWYLFPGVTVQVAINDGLILKAWATTMATHFLGSRSFLCELLCRFAAVDYTTATGQLYDVTSMCDAAKLNPEVAPPPNATTDYTEFTISHYKRIVKYKTAYYTYLLPLLMGLMVSTGTGSVDMNITERVAMCMGEYFQVQDDVMDCFTPPEKLGKIGTDIEDAKCSWLAATFLAIATDEQIAEFKKNYGHENPEQVAVVKRLYSDAKLLDEFAKYEVQVVTEVDELIKSLEKTSPAFAGSVAKLWAKTYKRQK